MAFVLDQEFVHASPCRNRRPRQQRCIPFALRDDLRVANARHDQLAKSPDAGVGRTDAVRAARRHQPRVEQLAQRSAARRRLRMFEMQQSAARHTLHFRIELAVPRTTRIAHLLADNHRCSASVSTSVNTPAAVTPAPAPGPVITSGFVL